MRSEKRGENIRYLAPVDRRGRIREGHSSTYNQVEEALWDLEIKFSARAKCETMA